MYDVFTIAFGILLGFGALHLLEFLFELPAQIRENNKRAHFEHHLKQMANQAIAEFEAKRAEEEAAKAKKPRRRAPVAKPATIKKPVAKKAPVARKAAK